MAGEEYKSSTCFFFREVHLTSMIWGSTAETGQDVKFGAAPCRVLAPPPNRGNPVMYLHSVRIPDCVSVRVCVLIFETKIDIAS